MNKEVFINELKKLNIMLSSYQLDQLDRYYKLLIEWNEKINLTRITDEKDVYFTQLISQENAYGTRSIDILFMLKK